MTTPRREPSLRANARARCRESAARDEPKASIEPAATPLPNPPPTQVGLARLAQTDSEPVQARVQRGRELTEQAGTARSTQAQTTALEPLRRDGDYRARVRGLYEDSALTVREIARLAGVSERMIFLYARQGGWMPRAPLVAARRRAGAWRLADTAALAEAKSRALAREAEAAALARLRTFELLHQALRDVVNLRVAAAAQRDRAAGRRTAVLADRLAAAIIQQLDRGLQR